MDNPEVVYTGIACNLNVENNIFEQENKKYFRYLNKIYRMIKEALPVIILFISIVIIYKYSIDRLLTL